MHKAVDQDLFLTDSVTVMFFGEVGQVLYFIFMQAVEGIVSKIIRFNLGLCEDTVGLWR
jgi:hypothetical protein